MDSFANVEVINSACQLSWFNPVVRVVIYNCDRPIVIELERIVGIVLVSFVQHGIDLFRKKMVSGVTQCLLVPIISLDKTKIVTAVHHVNNLLI
ncbi:hypothetical protein D3C86_1862660 [compost metagenome]